MERIVDNYDVDRETCERDLLELLNEMAGMSLVVFRE